MIDVAWDMKEAKAQENLRRALQERVKPEPADTVSEEQRSTHGRPDETNERRREIEKESEDSPKSGDSDEDLRKALSTHVEALESEGQETPEPVAERQELIQEESDETEIQDEKLKRVAGEPREDDGSKEDTEQDLTRHLDSQQREGTEIRGRTLERGSRWVNMHIPEYDGKKLYSFEQVEDLIQRDVPGLMEHRDIEEMLRHGRAHMEAIERFRCNKTVTNMDITEFAKEVDIPEKTVRAWITEGAEPQLYPTMDNALTKDDAEAKVAKVREGLNGVDSFDELQKRLSHPYHEEHTKKQVRYPKDLESSRKYFAFLDEMEKGGTISDVSRRVGIRQPSGSRYLEGRKTRLIKSAMEPIPEHMVEETRERDRIDSPRKYREALERNPFVKEHPDFERLDHEARVYTKFMELKRRGELPDRLVKDLAEEHKVGKQQLASWLSERKTQELVRNLEIYDMARATHESKLKPEAFEHRFDPSKVYEHFQHLREVKHPTADQLAEAIENMYRSSGLTSRVQWGELKPYHGGGPRWLREVAQSIHDHRAEVEAALNKRLGLDTDPDTRMRLGVLDSKLYLRREDTSLWNWMNIYKNEVFHFKRLDQKKELVDEAKARLDIQGGTRLSELAYYLTDLEKAVQNSRPRNDLNRTMSHLRGESLHLVLDATEQNIQGIQDEIKRIGMQRNGRGGISNPQFPSDVKEIMSMFTSVLGAGLSDGHIEISNDGFVYAEGNRDRVDIFNKQVDRFGDVYRSEDIRPDGNIRTRYASTFGRALERKGLTSGDKCLQNNGFQDWLKNACPEVKRKYYGPLWAEDGNFNNGSKGHPRFQWDRAVVLRDPAKSENYDFEPLATQEHADLVSEFGILKESDCFEGIYGLTIGRLKKLTSHPDDRIAQTAQSLYDVAINTESELLNDEIDGLGSLSIEAKPYLVKVNFSEKTGRLSSLWHASTLTKDDAMRTAILCPPEDIRKYSDVRLWMMSEDDLKNRVRTQIREEGQMTGDELNEV
ncbi:MAG: hypothetical protein ACFFER_10430 [Candidatus Thorarchaeota archaeon]